MVQAMTTINAMVLNKTKQVSLSTLDALCGTLGVRPGELLERDESETPANTSKSAAKAKRARG
jgi:DNA-binding Xre family transcriptional regulator